MLQSVRVIHLSRDTLFWFDVHAGKPGLISTGVSTDISRLAQLNMPPQVVSSVDKAGAQPAVEGQLVTSQLAAAAEVGAVEEQHDFMMQRVKAWNATHHPMTVQAQPGTV